MIIKIAQPSLQHTLLSDANSKTFWGEVRVQCVEKNRMSRQKKNHIKGSIKRRIEPLLYVFSYTM